MRARRRMVLVALAFAMLAAGAAPASGAEAGGALVAQKADTSAFPTVALTVTLPLDMLIGGAAEPRFEITENGERRDVIAATPLAATRAPMDVVLLIDTSGSMWGAPLQDVKRAAMVFVGALAEGDEVAVVSFDTNVEMVSGFTADTEALGAAIERLEASGNTALYDGVVSAAGMLAAREGRDRVLILLCDGEENASGNTLSDAVSRLRESGAPMYAIGLETPEMDREVLATLATQSGGRLMTVADSGELERLYADIARELTTQYEVSYTSAAPNTVDLDIEVAATVDGRAGTTRFVVDNPYFEQAAGEGEGVTPASPVASAALAALVVFLAFVAVFLAAWAVMSLMPSAPSRINELHFYDQLHGAEDTTTTRAAGVTGVIREAVAAVAGRRGLTPLVHRKLERAGLPLRAVEYMYLHFIGVIAAGMIVQLLVGSLWFSLLVVIVATLLPILLLESAITRRRHAFEEQLPDILSMMASSLRAGWGVQQSIDLVVQEIGDPASNEFRRVQAESRLGLSVEEALDKMAERLDSEDFRWTVTAIAIQREVGGNLAEVLDLVANTMRQRAELRRHIRALTSEGRLSAAILFVLPFFMMGLLLLVNPGYMGQLFTTSMGIGLLIVGAVLLAVGGVWLRKASEVEI